MLLPEWHRPLAGALSAVLLAGAAAPAGPALALATPASASVVERVSAGGAVPERRAGR